MFAAQSVTFVDSGESESLRGTPLATNEIYDSGNDAKVAVDLSAPPRPEGERSHKPRKTDITNLAQSVSKTDPMGKLENQQR